MLYFNATAKKRGPITLFKALWILGVIVTPASFAFAYTLDGTGHQFATQIINATTTTSDNGALGFKPPRVYFDDFPDLHSFNSGSFLAVCFKNGVPQGAVGVDYNIESQMTRSDLDICFANYIYGFPANNIPYTTDGNYVVDLYDNVTGLIHYGFASYTVSGGIPGNDKTLNDTTRIIEMIPSGGVDSPGTTTPSGVPVNLGMRAYINADDMGGFSQSLSIYLRNIDQNVVLGTSRLSPSDIVLFNDTATTSGAFNFASSTILGDGNYRLYASITKKSLFGLWTNFMIASSSQFVVGTSTWIGDVRQQGFRDLNDFANGLTATSSEANASTCNPLNTSFSIRQCLLFLLVPSSDQIDNAFTFAKDGILTRWPWGYITRLTAILSNTASTSLPSFTVHVATSASSTEALTFDPGDMLAGGATLLESIHDPINNKSPKDIFEPLVKLSVSLIVLMTIFADITKSHQHHAQGKHQTT